MTYPTSDDFEGRERVMIFRPATFRPAGTEAGGSDDE